jgi:hypothetical protein
MACSCKKIQFKIHQYALRKHISVNISDVLQNKMNNIYMLLWLCHFFAILEGTPYNNFTNLFFQNQSTTGKL